MAKGILVLIGTFLVEFSVGTVYTLGNVNSYLTSYVRRNGFPDVTYGWAIRLHAASLIGQGVGMIGGGYIAKSLSVRQTCLLGCLIHCLSTMSTSYTMRLGFFGPLISLGLLPGLGSGIVYLNLVANSFAWFPNKRGLVAGVVMSGFGLGTFVFNIMHTTYVNPNNLSPLPGDDGYFTQEEILERTPGLFMYSGLVYGSIQFIGFCLLFEPPPPPPTAAIEDKKLNEKSTNLPFSKSIRTREFWVLFGSNALPSPGIMFVTSLMKQYGQLFIHDDLFLATVQSLGFISNSLNRVIWGLVYDAFGFGACYSGINILFGLCLMLAPFEFILSSKLLYLIVSMGLLGLFGGWKSSFPVHLACLFGNATTTMNFGVFILSQAVIGIGFGSVVDYLTHNLSRFTLFYMVAGLQFLGLVFYHLFYPEKKSLVSELQ